MKPSMPPELLAELRRFNTPTVCNAVEAFAVRLRNEGYTLPTVRAHAVPRSPMVGHAVTMRIRSGGPALDGHRYFEDTRWWDAVLAVPEPRVIVIQDLDAGASAGSFIGQVHAAILRAMGVVGVVTDGAVRDVESIGRLGLAVYSGTVSVSHAYAHVVDVGGAVEVAGLKVESGDWLHGDVHGVISIPPEIGGALPAVAEKLMSREQELIDACSAPGDVLERLRVLLRAEAPPPARGTRI
jgi:regulator of RNase E activity RraA